MSILITGVAGFIGSNLASTFLSRGEIVFGLDNFCRGYRSNLSGLLVSENFNFVEVDLSNYVDYQLAIKKLNATNRISEIWHMAANSDIPAGVSSARIDLRDTFMTTFNTLEIMKEFGIGVIAFASSSAVYGDLGDRKLTEDIGPLFPISNYGAMKLASEAIISASVESSLIQAYIFRFPNVIGVPATHGVILDFIRKLKDTPDRLLVLGDGTQQKSYLHVDDLINAMHFIRNNSTERINYFNIGANDLGISVRDIATKVMEKVSPGAEIIYGFGDRGWVGDVPKFNYSIEKLNRLGWCAHMNSVEAVHYSVSQIAEQEASH